MFHTKRWLKSLYHKKNVWFLLLSFCLPHTNKCKSVIWEKFLETVKTALKIYSSCGRKKKNERYTKELEHLILVTDYYLVKKQGARWVVGNRMSLQSCWPRCSSEDFKAQMIWSQVMSIVGTQNVFSCNKCVAWKD